MINKRKFNLFGEEQTIFYNNRRLIEAERRTGTNISKLIMQDERIETICIMLEIGLQHEYREKKNLDFYIDKTDEYLGSEINTNGLSAIWDIIVLAVMDSGIMNNQVAKISMRHNSAMDVYTEIMENNADKSEAQEEKPKGKKAPPRAG